MAPDSTNARRNIEYFAFRAAAIGARIRDLCAESSRNQVSLLNLVRKNAISRGTPVRARGRRTKAHPGPAQAQPVYYRSIVENPVSLALLGE
jgi:hypothetical protein